VDKDALAAYCTAFSRWRESDEVVQNECMTYEITDKQGNQVIRRRPETAIAVEQLKLMKSLMAEFGLTPSSRSRIGFAGQEGLDDEDYLFGTTSGKR